MICSKCGNQIDGDSKFCTFCGAPIETIPQPAEPQQPVQQPMMQGPQMQQPQMQQPQGFNQQPQMQQPQGFNQQPQMQQPQGFSQQPQMQQPQGFNQQPQMQAPQQGPQGFNQQPQMQQPQGFNQQPQMQAPQQPQGFNQQPQMQQPQGFNQQPAPPQQPKSKAPLIIGIVAGAVVLIGIVIGLILLLGKDKDDDTKAETTTEATEEVTTEATTEKASAGNAKPKDNKEDETTEATTEEAKVPAFAEENGCNMVSPSEINYTGQGALVFYDTNNNIIDLDYIEAYQKDYTESVGLIYKTEPDKNGFVTYYTQINLNLDANFTDTKRTTDWTFDLGAWAPDVVDYYTGKILDTPDYTTGLVDEDDEEYLSTVSVNDTDYDVTVARLFDNNSSQYTWDYTESGSSMNYVYRKAIKMVYIVKVPSDYDGAMLVFQTGDVDYDEYIAEYDVSDSDLTLFEADSAGYQYNPESTLCLRLSDYGLSNSDDFCNILSTNYVGHPEDSFNWIGDYYNGELSLDRVENNDLLNGTWNGFLWWDQDNEMGSYSEEYLNVDVYAYQDNLEMTFKYNVQRFSSSGDWRDKSDISDDIYTGNFDAEGSANLTGGEVESFTIDGFYTDGYVQVAIGKITLSSGESASVFMYRP